MASNSITEYVQQDAIKENIAQVLKERTPQFISSIVSLVKTNPKLEETDKGSIMRAALIAASLDLPINSSLGFAYIIPYFDGKSKTMLAQFQIGYKGIIQLSQRSGLFKTINTSPVYEGDTDESVMKRLISIITPEPPSDKVIGYVGYFKLLNGFEKTLYMTNAELKKHGLRFSQTYKKGYGLWESDFESMAKKTVTKLLLGRYAPLSTDMQKAQIADQAVVTEEGEYSYLDNEKPSIDEVGVQKHKERLLRCIDQAKTPEQLAECKSAVNEYNNDEITYRYAAKFKELTGESLGIS